MSTEPADEPHERTYCTIHVRVLAVEWLLARSEGLDAVTETVSAGVRDQAGTAHAAPERGESLGLELVDVRRLGYESAVLTGQAPSRSGVTTTG